MAGRRATRKDLVALDWLASVAEICRGILIEEAAMAEWLNEQIPAITHLMLEQVKQRKDASLSDRDISRW